MCTMRPMKEKFILACMLALVIVGLNFLVFSWQLAQILGYYILLIDAFFAICAIVLVRAYKRTQKDFP